MKIQTLKKKNRLQQTHFYWSKRFLFSILFIIIAFIVFFFSVPRPLFNTPFSTVVESSDGKLLGARIAVRPAVAVPGSRFSTEEIRKMCFAFRRPVFLVSSRN